MNSPTSDGIQKILEYMESQWDEIEVNDDNAESETKTIAEKEIVNGTLESIVFFDHTEANFHLRNILTLAEDSTEVTSNNVDATKTDRQSMTIVKKDRLEAG